MDDVVPAASPIKLTRRPRPPLVISTERWDFENLYRKEWFLAFWALTKRLGFSHQLPTPKSFAIL